jgi:hypothetical protein
MKKQGLFIIVIGLILIFQPLDAQTWNPQKRITWTSGDSHYPVIAMETNNNIHVVWIDDTPGEYDIYYKKSTDGGTSWLTKRLTWTSGDSSCPAIATDSSDNIHITWIDDTVGNRELFYKKSTNGGWSWSTKRLTWTSGFSTLPAIATDTSNNIHIVWQDDAPGNFEIYYKKSTNGGSSWSTKRLTWTSTWTSNPAIATDSSDNIHIVFEDGYQVYYKKSTNGGWSWTTKKLTWSSGTSSNPEISVGSNSHIHVVYENDAPGNCEIYYKKSTNGGSSWTTKRLTWNSGISFTHAISTDSSNNIHICSVDNTPGNLEIYHMRSTNGGSSWAKKRLTWNSGGSVAPSITFDSSNNIYLFWADETPGNYEIFYRKGIQ